MKQELYELWREALTSGEYNQWSGSLRSDPAMDEFFCCIGVLCDIVIKRPDLVPGLKSASWKGKSFVEEWEDAPYPKHLAIARPGMPSALFVETVSNKYHLGHLANMNDNGAPFTKIAKEIDSLVGDGSLKLEV